MDPHEEHRQQVMKNIASLGSDAALRESTLSWIVQANAHKYTYNFNWLGRPIIQYPQDIVAVQELIWQTKPDLIIETGIAHGGSLVLSASMLALLEYSEAVEAGATLDPRAPRRVVLGIDIDIRPHNRAAIESHPMTHRIRMMQGSSTAPEVVEKVRSFAKGYRKILIFLDSNHTHDHVLAELEAYAPLTSIGSYCCVFDTLIDDMPEDMFPDRPWGKTSNPKTAVREYLRRLSNEGRKAADGAPLRFEVDKTIDDKLQITVAPEGYLRRID